MDDLWTSARPATGMPQSSSLESVERACQLAETAGAAARHAAKQLEKAAASLESAARVGDPAKLRSATENLRSLIVDSHDRLEDATKAWPYSDDEVSAYLAGPYTEELVAAAQSVSLRLDRLDDRWSAFPVLLEVVPKSRSAKIDGKRTTSLRPSVLVDLIRARQSANGIKPDRFIEILYSAYKAIAEPLGVHLVDLYELLTLLPDAKAEYSRADFGRDVYLLDTSPVFQTKSGAAIEFKGSTGAKGSPKALTVIPPEGMPKHYYAVSFRDPE